MAEPQAGLNQASPGRGALPVLAGGLALAVILLGVIALLGWLLQWPGLASFGGGRIPMAPSTAVFFLVYGGGVLALLLPRLAFLRRLVFLPLLAAANLIALAVIFLSLQGVYSPLEHLGLAISGDLNGAPLGHMSPLSALSFSLIGLVLILLLAAGDSLRRWQLWAALAQVSVPGLMAFALVLAYIIGAPVLHGGFLVPVALPTALAFLLLTASLQLVLAQRLLPVSLRPPGEVIRPFYGLLLIFVLLVGGIITAGFVSFRHHEQEHRAAMEQKMTAIALLKAERISAWLREHQNLAEELAANRGFAARLEQWVKYGDWDERDIILRRLEDQRAAYHFCGTMVLNERERTIYTLGESLAGDVELAALVEQARVKGRVVSSELFRGVNGKICLAWVIPIFSPGDGQPAAYIARHLSADIFLFPFLANWPGISRSAETLLVRRDGDDVLYLNKLKFNPAAPLSLRVPLSRQELPEVQAVLGRHGIATGRDYRGVQVLAAVTAVPGTSWQVVSRIDLHEMYAPLRERLGVIVLAVLLLLLGAGGGVALLWHRQQQDHRFALLAQAAARDRQLNVELERRVAERTAQLEEVNRELETFSYAVSHDLKAPLRGIKGYSRLLEEDCQPQLNEEGRLLINSIHAGVERMEKLIDDLLAYSRLERRRIIKQKLDLAALVQMVLAEFRAELAEIGAELRTDVPSVLVRLDPDGLGMALRNLVANAIKFSRAARPPRLAVSAEVTPQEIVLKVEDNGIGFDMKFKEQIFEIFTRLERTDDFPGSGVGLALVIKSVQRMGGRVWAESSPGRGAAFFIEIPRSPLEIESAEQRSNDD